MLPRSEIVALKPNTEVVFLVTFFNLTFSTGSMQRLSRVRVGLKPSVRLRFHRFKVALRRARSFSRSSTILE
jgi:hypothetical protein